MAIRYFKKLAPENPVRLTGNIAIKFKTVDRVIGYLATLDDNVSAQFEVLMRQGEYGLSEISAVEFTNEYLAKKNISSSQPAREEFGSQNPNQLIDHARQVASAGQAAAVNAEASPPVAPTPAPAVPKAAIPDAPVIATPDKPATTAPIKPDFTPPVGKRKRVAASRSTKIE